MCSNTGKCDFYQRHKESKRSSIQRLVEEYCNSPEGERNCRRQLIWQYYEVRLTASVAPTGDYLD